MARRTSLRKQPRKTQEPDKSLPTSRPDVAITSVAISANNLLVTLSTPMFHVGSAIPAITCQGVAPIAILSVTPTTFVLDYTANVATGNSIVVPTQDPAFRNAGGGFIKAGTFLVP